MSIESVMLSNHLILCCPLLLLPSTFPSIRVFSNEPVLHITWPKIGASASAEHSGLIFFRIDWLDLPAVQGALKSLLQRQNFKASTLQHSVFFMVQLLYPYMTTGNTTAVTIWSFVGKLISLLSNTLSVKLKKLIIFNVHFLIKPLART